jgi:hypothetical protein
MARELEFLPEQYRARVADLLGVAYLAGMENGSMGVTMLAVRTFIKNNPAFTVEAVCGNVTASCPEATVSKVQQALEYLVSRGELVVHERGYVAAMSGGTSHE